MPTVTLRPSGHQEPARVGATLLAVVRAAGLPIGFSCRGRGVCLACRLHVEGALAPPDPQEQALLARVAAEVEAAPLDGRPAGGWRIACLARVAGDVAIQADYW